MIEPERRPAKPFEAAAGFGARARAGGFDANTRETTRGPVPDGSGPPPGVLSLRPEGTRVRLGRVAAGQKMSSPEDTDGGPMVTWRGQRVLLSAPALTICWAPAGFLRFAVIAPLARPDLRPPAGADLPRWIAARPEVSPVPRDQPWPTRSAFPRLPRLAVVRIPSQRSESTSSTACSWVSPLALSTRSLRVTTDDLPEHLGEEADVHGPDLAGVLRAPGPARRTGRDSGSTTIVHQASRVDSKRSMSA